MKTASWLGLSVLLSCLWQSARAEQLPPSTTAPFKLTIETNKLGTVEGEAIELTYKIQNISKESAGYFEGFIDGSAKKSSGENFESHRESVQTLLPRPGNHVLLAPGQDKTGRFELGPVDFKEIADAQVNMGKFNLLATRTILYNGPVLIIDPTVYFLSESFDGRALISARYCTSNPNPNEPAKPAWVGCLDSAPVEIRINLPQKKEGVVKTFYEGGAVMTVRNFVDGKLAGVAKDFYQSGALLGEWPFKNGRLDGVSHSYFENGKVASKATFKNGQLWGPVLGYFENSEVFYSATFKKGQPHGLVTFTQERGLQSPFGIGLVKHQSAYINGELEGPSREFYDNGRLAIERLYKENDLQVVKEYDKSGHLVFTYDYRCPGATLPEKHFVAALPLAAKSFLSRAELQDKGLLLQMKPGFLARYRTMPVYVSKQFKNGTFWIPQGSTLTKFRSTTTEPEDLKKSAFLAAFPVEDKKGSPYQYLYVGSLNSQEAVIVVAGLIQNGDKSKAHHTFYLRQNQEFRDKKTCASSR